MTDFRANLTLWNSFLDECKNTTEGEYKWETVKLKGHPTEEEHKKIIDEIFIKRASLPQIVKRHMFYKKL
tara:strand:+ start:54 stop:263 length:210 start_codon:yes stop_codon:yes gene_type:complete